MRNSYQVDISCRCKAADEIERLTAEGKNISDAAEMLWVVLANVSGGDWDKQSDEWRSAAERWRDYYFSATGVKENAYRDMEGCQDPPIQPTADIPTHSGILPDPDPPNRDWKGPGQTS